MSRFIKYFFLFIIAFVFLNCAKEVDKNLYYGLYAFEDLHFSNPLIIDVEKKKVLSAGPKLSTDVYSLTDSTLLKKDLVFKLNYKDGYLRTERDSAVVHVFKKVLSDPPSINDKSEILKVLQSGIWVDKSNIDKEEESLKQNLYYQFGDTTLLRLSHKLFEEEIVQTEVEEYSYKLVDFAQRYFLYLKSPNPESRFSSFLELKTFKKGSVVFSGIKGNEDLKLNITKDNKSIFFEQQKNQFGICNEDLIGQYYYNGLGSNYKGGLRRIKELLINNYIRTNNEQDSGYVRIRFVINCLGETGRFSIHQVDKEYQPNTFSTSLIKQLFDFTKSLSDWKLGKLTDTGKPYDNYRHLTFKIENGEVLEIFP